jgi:hypothetical protein
MKHYYQAELATAVERLRATMAAAESWALEPCIVKKGQTLYVVRGERSELRRAR